MSYIQGKALALLVSLSVDVEHFDASSSGPDPGSKQWLLAQALTHNEDYYSEAVVGKPSKEPCSNDVDVLHDSGDENTFSNSKTDSDELPEDAFHRKDASSLFIIEQREKSLKEKSDKFERCGAFHFSIF